mmetsp:Transcript_10005/g.16618  ORF Transcript_10005/g.16618 Transcript_10005/m.16618 type:complete len:186 (-) Transcript_10005:153-710(-)
MQILIPLLLVGSVASFAPSSISSSSSATELAASSRRQILGSAFVSASTILIGASSAFADVSEGNQLPDGAAQFSRLLKVKYDIPSVKKRLTENAADLDKKEWLNIGGFLRRIYAEADDLKVVGGGLSPDKKKQGAEIAEQIRKYSKAGEAPINAQDAPAVINILDKCDGLFGDFLDLLSDVPDEI